MSARPDTGPLVCVIRPSQIPRSGRTVEIVASAAQCSAIQTALEIDRLDALAATLTLAPGVDGAMEVRARMRAAMGRRCVVTLEIFDTEIDETFSEVFHPQPGGGPVPRAEIVVEPEGPDDAETYDNDEIDLGALVVEHLALALDPHPRAPDAPRSAAVLDALGLEKPLAAKVTVGADDEAQARPSPFAVLAGRGAGGRAGGSGNGNQS